MRRGKSSRSTGTTRSTPARSGYDANPRPSSDRDLLAQHSRRAAGLHRHAVEAVGGLHRALLVADDDELRFLAELVHEVEEAVQVDVVEGGLDLVHHVERRRTA